MCQKICRYYDDKFGNTDTVCMISDIGKKPAMSYWIADEYIRRHENIQNKRIIVYKACKHQEAKKPIVSRDEFTEFVKKISIQYENDDVSKITDIMDEEFGPGCHYCRGNPGCHYDIFSRFNDDYDAAFKLESGAYIIAWRR